MARFHQRRTREAAILPSYPAPGDVRHYWMDADSGAINGLARCALSARSGTYRAPGVARGVSHITYSDSDVGRPAPMSVPKHRKCQVCHI